MTILTRRRILQTSVAALALTSVPCLALAHSHSDQLLADILIGVGDALQREWIRDNYGHGHWDGHYWNYGGHRYTPLEYRDYWLSRYQPPAPPPPPRPVAPRLRRHVGLACRRTIRNPDRTTALVPAVGDREVPVRAPVRDKLHFDDSFENG